MNKKISQMLVLLLMVAFLFPVVGNAADASELTAQQKYDALAAKGIFAGIDGKAELDQNMNRAQFARVAALILGLEGIGNPDTKVVTEKPFSDVELGLWYTEEIAAAKEASIMIGNGNGTFNPRGDITIQELAVTTARLLDIDPVENSEVEGAADWAAGYIQALLKNGVDFPTNYTEPAKRSDLVAVSFLTEVVITEKKEAEKKKTEESTPTQTPTQTPAQIALEKINTSVGSWTNVDVTTFTTAGVTGVTTTNLSAVLDALEADGSSRWTVSQIQTIVNAVISKQAALDLINTSVGTWTNVDESTFVNAGITGVTTDNLSAVQEALDSDGSSPWTVSQIQSIVDAVITKHAALDLINTSVGTWTNVDESTFENAGITGVTTSNLSAVLDALEGDGRSPWTVSQIQDIVNEVITKHAALDLINTSVGTWTNVDESTFSNAGITGVTTDNLSAVLDALEADGRSPWTVLDIQTIVNSVIDDFTNQSPLDLIISAAATGKWTYVTVATFSDAGLEGVTADNLYYVQHYLEISAPLHQRTLDQIQAIVDEAIQEMMVDAIYDYLNPYGGGSRPTVEVFELAGITGVTALNLNDILDQLNWAYQDAKNDPFGTPMSTKQDIQNVINPFLGLS